MEYQELQLVLLSLQQDIKHLDVTLSATRKEVNELKRETKEETSRKELASSTCRSLKAEERAAKELHAKVSLCDASFEEKWRT